MLKSLTHSKGLYVHSLSAFYLRLSAPVFLCVGVAHCEMLFSNKMVRMSVFHF